MYVLYVFKFALIVRLYFLLKMICQNICVSKLLNLLLNWFIKPTVFFQFSVDIQFSSVAQSDSLRPHELQHARPPCPLPTPGVYPNPCASSWWCHPTISSSVLPFSSCPQSFPASGPFRWVSSSHQVAKVLEFQLQNQSFQWTPRTDLL